MKIGLVVAVEIEAIKKIYGEPIQCREVCRQKIMKYMRYTNEIYAIQSGAGQIAAAAATQLLICEVQPDLIVNFGVVGALTEAASHNRRYVVNGVVQYDFDTSCADNCEIGRHLEYPTVIIPLSSDYIRKSQQIIKHLPTALCASGSKFVASENEKNHIHVKFGADIIDMEAAGIVLTADKNHISCLLIKMVADGLTGGVEEFKKEFRHSSEMCLTILDKITGELA
ncbi:MAG: hypothetical protein P1P65_06045 [Treponema sp.]